MQKVALIPARSGSKRIPHKNITLVNGHPLIAYTIYQAKLSKLFDRIIVLTDSKEYGDIASNYGAEIPYLRNPEKSKHNSPDILWLKEAVEKLQLDQKDTIFILRPTSPLRDALDIKRAWKTFSSKGKNYDSLRAMSPVTEHPGKMWRLAGTQAVPLLPYECNDGVPWHSSQTNTLPECYIQNASLEIIKVDALCKTERISGNSVFPFIMEGYNALDINIPEDLDMLMYLLERRLIKLPELE